ncbi:probable galactinol--sucrose galactosyltransferase 2 [Tanacetum coccineum]
MTQRMGTCGKDIPLETQFMLLECKDNNEGPNDNSPTIYAVFLPLLEGQFRAVLQGNEKNELEICLESEPGKALPVSLFEKDWPGHLELDHEPFKTTWSHLVYMNAGTNPFEVITQAVKAVENHMQTFHHREKKKLPGVLDWFGWCTWDAFYTDVTAEGVEKGIKSLSEGGTSPRFLIIDDGWQQIGNENKDTNVVVQEGAKSSTASGDKSSSAAAKAESNTNYGINQSIPITENNSKYSHQHKLRDNSKYPYNEE